MFTGIIEEIGTVSAIEKSDDGQRVGISAPLVNELDPGESISVNGVCLTVETLDRHGGVFSVFISDETICRSYLGILETGARVNLERAMENKGRFDGHIVQGHVDGTGRITLIRPVGDDWWMEISLPSNLRHYVVEKGSIAIDGISLTVAEIDSDNVGIAIIPATVDRTTLDSKDEGDPVNIEVDIIAKYVERLIRPYQNRGQA